jgi:hypothetical protein
MTAASRFADVQALEGRLAARVGAVLAQSTDSLPHDITERLRVAREQAVVRARQVRAAAPAPAVGVVGLSGGAALLGAPVSWWQRAASVLPLVVLLGGLVAVDRLAEQEQIHAAAEIDALLLADDLPPAAYSDPGFAQFLRSTPPP